ncbi:MAG: acyltransferase [Anaeromyxobacter sp.]|nr:acyltransferase [Anaeromyxobacter sp.]
MTSMPDPGQGTWAPRYEMLDGWRGLAAVAVVFHHLGMGHGINLGHNAVAVFFVISGYCVTAAGDTCITRRVGLGEYLRRRLRRIYPPYFFAVLFYLATRVVKLGVGMGGSVDHGWAYWLQNFTLTQWLSLLRFPASFAADNPSLSVAAFWSLNYEEQFYLVLGALLVAARWGGRAALPLGILLLLAAGAAWNVAFPAISYGWFLEYWVLFGVGGIVYIRLCWSLSSRARWAVDGGLAATGLLAAALASLQDGWGVVSRNAYLEWLVAVAFALLLVVMRRWSEPFGRSLAGAALMKLGTITYSLYLIHQFNLRSSEVAVRFLLPRAAPHGLVVASQVTFLVLLASLFWYAFERPFLNRAPPGQGARLRNATGAAGSVT